MGKCLSLYGPVEFESYVNNCYSVGACSIRGSRKTWEDRYTICLAFPNHPTFSLFAVFDGFNGHCASAYLRNNFVRTLDNLYTLDDDQLIINEINKMDQTFLKSKNPNINSECGSTIVFALIEKDIYPTAVSSVSISMPSPLTLSSISLRDSQSTGTYQARIFWVGDSRAIRIKSDQKTYSSLTTDHHCDLADELIRIKKANGQIINNKIDGICGLSRCFGCLPMKNNKKLANNEQKMICIAQCKKITFESEETLLLFSDGMTQKWNDDSLIRRYNFHYNQNENYKNALQKSLNYLIEECIDCGSKDNITAISIKFQ